MTLYERYTTGDSIGVSMYGIRWYAQTFTVGNTGDNIAHTIVSVKLKLGRIGSPGTVTVSIRAVDGEGKPTGGDLAVGTINGNTLTADAGGKWYIIALSWYELAASTQYAIVVRALSGDSDNKIFWRFDRDGTYTGGAYVASSNSGGSWDLWTTRDFMFEEYGPPEICSWIEAKGGPTGLTIADVFVIIDSYLYETPPSGYTFIPTLQNVFGVIDYYLGFDGDAATGCDFFP